MRHIYLDHNATTPIAPSVQEAMLPFLAEHFGNPSSTHALGRACQEAVADARSMVAELLGCESDEVVFTSGGTESNNLALKGVFLRLRPFGEGHLVISQIEHPAISAPAEFVERLGFSVSVISADADGVVDPQEVAANLRPDTRLVSIMLANNEIGSIQPIDEISEVCREHKVLLHTDAAQAVGKIPVDVNVLGVDMLSVAGHKTYAPKGIGALYVRRGTPLEPLLHGAGHEGGVRAGTENVPYIVGLGTAARLAGRAVDEASQQLAQLRDRLQNRLQEAIPRLSVNGANAERLPNTLSANFPGVAGNELLNRAPEICASTGAACHSGTSHLSATLEAIGLGPTVAQGTVRLSLGWHTTEDDIERTANLLITAWESLQ